MSKILCPPKPELLKAIAAGNLKWKVALGEWIDNALDAGAKIVQIALEGKTLIRISDDGGGCAEPQDLVTLGSHHKHKSGSTKLGRYGIGAKDAALWVGGENSSIKITSVHNSKRYELFVNWTEYAESGWEIEEPSVAPAEPGDRGTTIIVKPNTKVIPEGQRWKELLDELGYLYSPAIKSGIQITVKRKGAAPPEVLQRWILPPLQADKVDTVVRVGNQTARVYCGIVEDGVPNPRCGLTYSYKFRVVRSSSSDGCGTYNIARVCGFVEIDESWRLSRNKDSLFNPEELFDAVKMACLPVLKRAETLGQMLQSEIFDKELTQRLRLALGQSPQAKARRDRGETAAEAFSTGKGQAHKRAKREQPGTRFPSAREIGAVRIVHENLGPSVGVGQVKMPHIFLNRDHQFVERLYEERNADACVMLALSLLTAEWSFAPDGQIPFKGIRAGGTPEDFNNNLSSILSGIPEEKKIAAA